MWVSARVPRVRRLWGTHAEGSKANKFRVVRECDTRTTKKYRPESLTTVLRRVGQLDLGPHVT